MPTFFVDRKNLSGDTAVLSGTEAGHMLRSLRLSVGDSFFAFDEEGKRYRMRILEATSRSLRAEILESFPPEPPPDVAVSLFVGLPKADKLDFILEKATELGVSRVIPFRSSRTIPRLDPADARKRLSRWERVALAAAKQCGSGRVPEVSGIVPFPEALRRTAIDLTLTLPAYVCIFLVIWWFARRHRYSAFSFFFVMGLGQALGDGQAYFLANPAMLVFVPYVMSNYWAMTFVPFLLVRGQRP